MSVYDEQLFASFYYDDQTSFHKRMLKSWYYRYNITGPVGDGGNAMNVYSGGARFESWPKHRLDRTSVHCSALPISVV
jgi:hypothetical protein